jgi:hypothetical protein
MTTPERERPLVGNYPPVPETFTCLPDDEYEIEERQTDFFVAIVEALGYRTPESRAFCQVRTRHLIREGDASVDANATDDRVTELVVHERTVAVVLAVRTGFNFTQAIFTLALTPDLEELVRFKG